MSEPYQPRRFRPERLELLSRAGEVLSDAAAVMADLGRQHEAGILGAEFYAAAMRDLERDVRAATRTVEAWQRNTLPDLEHIAHLLAASVGPIDF